MLAFRTSGRSSAQGVISGCHSEPRRGSESLIPIFKIKVSLQRYPTIPENRAILKFVFKIDRRILRQQNIREELVLRDSSPSLLKPRTDLSVKVVAWEGKLFGRIL